MTRNDGLEDPTLGGWYVQSGVFLTGESRNLDIKSGKYKATTPLNSYGALELAARYNDIDVDDNDVRGGKEQNITLGVNWWIKTHFMIRCNDVYADVSRSSGETLTRKDESAHAFTGRAQVVF